MSSATQFKIPLTFRAAGTSLSGQAVSDSVLVVAGKLWEKYTILNDGEQICLQPGIIGSRVNAILKPYHRRFSPDPASINSAMVGGIVMNNASGMNCGTHANSNEVLLAARIIFTDGTLLDTADSLSRELFCKSHGVFIHAIEELRDAVCSDGQLVQRIRHKYSIKNVMGLNLLPFVQFRDPFEILAHLLVGSEGSLAFLSSVTVRTEQEYPYKACSMVYFREIREACQTVITLSKLHDETGARIVYSAELLDAKSLASVNDTTGEGLTALLIETKAQTSTSLTAQIAVITEQIHRVASTFNEVHFTSDREQMARYWKVRSGIFPAVGGSRQLGTTCLIEDVAFHIEDLPSAVAELQSLIAKHGYNDACIYGHALDGNFHFIINQPFNSVDEVRRYELFMNEVADLVVDRYDGSLKAEHGTGRNMAPFVRREWGDTAFEVMLAVKRLFDPDGILNPGVIFNDDPRCHVSHLKQLPLTDPIVDKCIECGFCEVNCLSCGFTFSSRQRIAIQREMSRLRQSGENLKLLKEIQRAYRYAGEQTCAGDGLCSMSCPVGINMGDMTHAVRARQLSRVNYSIGDFLSKHFVGAKRLLRWVLTLADTTYRILGRHIMTGITAMLHRFVGIPQWLPTMPRAYCVPKATQQVVSSYKDKVVYFPSCINQTMGLARDTQYSHPLVEEMIQLLNKGGYEVIFPNQMDKLCCGTIWESKGMMQIADRKTAELEQALLHASEQGRYPVLCDQSPCLHRMREKIRSVQLYEPAEFIWKFLQPRLHFHPISDTIAIHITCSMRRMGLAETIVNVAHLCATQVIVPDEVGCCGFAGDKGFVHPELNAYALRKLRPVIEQQHVAVGYSNSRTCEIGLSARAGVPYVSIVYLVNAVTTPRIASTLKQS
jgi:D-lactate dehydrogenase